MPLSFMQVKPAGLFTSFTDISYERKSAKRENMNYDLYNNSYYRFAAKRKKIQV